MFLEKAIPSLDIGQRKVFLKNKLAPHLPEHERLLIKFNADKSWQPLLDFLEETLPYLKAKPRSRWFY